MTITQYTPSEGDINHFLTIAKSAHASGLYNSVGGESKILMIILSAKELGIPIMQALNGGIWNIQGKVEISARMVNSMLRKAGVRIKIVRLDNRGCVLEGERSNGDKCTVSFLEEDAKAAGVLGRNVWKSHPEDMYFARAISKLGRRLAPDVLGTAYIEGEIDEENEKEAVKPENLPTAEVEVQEYKQDTNSLLNEYIASLPGNKDETEQYIAAIQKAYPKMSIIEIIDMLKVNPEETLSKFEIWKGRQRSKKAA